jgi:hypothetical protein
MRAARVFVEPSVGLCQGLEILGEVIFWEGKHDGVVFFFVVVL